METQAPAAPTKRAPVFEDLIDIFLSPADVFRRRKDGQFGIALIVYIVVGTALFVLTRRYLEGAFEGDFMRGIEAARRQNPNLTDDQIATMRSIGEKVAIFGAPIILLVTVFLVGFVTWLVGKLFGANLTLGLAVMVATYSQYPRLLQGVINAIQGYVMDPAKLTSMFSVTLSPARFLDPASTSPVLLAALSRLDLFTIWCTILLGLGLHIVGNIPKSKAFAAAAVVWLLGSLAVVVPALRQG